ncbi:hypothetical protein CYPRO_2054 [Cyclonatronum proteinivorum]|uniref:Uncharacterized protein n=1 Tax=Cyclonatronum proteinivorum TaxID=1457365 RepID=A0A345ULF2_9BACT|nr:hypothetical protein [Cyclonatronum proteinivorum]AXJ01304.1 hypothetical protein CYPRO_2054 [Cyclonatronum proteinivorum]
MNPAPSSSLLLKYFTLLLLTLLFLPTEAFPQLQSQIPSDLSLPEISAEAAETNPNPWFPLGQERLSQENLAMLILLGWGGLNVLGGSALALGSADYRDFGLMTAGWGLVNAAIAGFALAGADTYTAAVSFDSVLRDEMLFNRILAINSGLNAGYIATGFTMNYLGSTSRVRQFGSAFMVQGAFLMAFDAWLLWHSTDRLSRLSALPDTFLTALPDGSTQLIHGLTLSFGF